MPRCPYYLNGLCYSPKTIEKYGSPSSEPVNLGYCLSDNYNECSYYTIKSSEELYKYMGIEESTNIYLPIHIIPCNYNSECPFFEVKQIEENVCVSRCTYLDKYITRSSVEKCIKYWDKCPFYKMASEQVAHSLSKH
ncbi:hypothetical protein Smar_0536 [Staphylothermus marinus F1]|uniref:Uncharacterized protein n=1 Tax=Staphylothermus marinus (strain ATCC 43588 / DSM 3639 / JCM 9404 / F1) TaxID=399550 RepID=A3DLY3_STAMF|nr:hypothetical protein Smar_0536 [Staphylothermus marinus F1]